MPDKKIFPSIEFNANTIKERIKESSFLYKNLKIVFFNEEIKEEAIYQSENGIAEYVKFINDGKTTLHNIAYFEGKNDGIEVEIAFQYTTSSNEIIVSFANSVKTNEGGSHETAFKSIVTEMFNTIARK
jgi:topoisomerase-4 subunit B